MNEQVASIHKQYLLADRIKLHLQDTGLLFQQFSKSNIFKKQAIRLIRSSFGSTWDKQLFRSVKNSDHISLLLFQDSLLYLTIFYGLAYATAEAWIDAGLQDDAVNALLQDKDKLDLLRKFRNASFHVQKEFISKKHLVFLEQHDSETWIKKLHTALGQALARHPDVSPFFDAGLRLR